MKTKERLAIPPVHMKEQDPRERIKNQKEVPLGYTSEQARREASRCLQCRKAPCVSGCPVGIDIPGFIEKIEKGDFQAAILKLKEKNVLPAICGRVCPQEEQCQLPCTVGKSRKSVEESVAIGKLERFAADWERQNGNVILPDIPPKTGKRAAVIGSGPAGLTVAGDLIKLGHGVTIFEALHKPGGVLTYGIPEFRLPKEIVNSEVEYLKKLGVEIKYNYIIGKIKSLVELLSEYDSVFIGTGAGLPSFLRIEGENLLGVYSANEYLTRANLMRAFDQDISDTPILRGNRVAIVGGGNVAMDAARTALRLGAEKSIIAYRRSEKEMPARNEEIEHAKEEGVEFHLLVNPIRILGNDDGWVTGMEMIRMQLGEPDSSGRRRPVPIKDSEFQFNVDVVIVAIGNSPNPLIPRETPGLKVNNWGGIIVDETTGATSIPGVYAGGDIVLGAATVILAMGEGRRAAQAMHEYMSKN
ncbi:NADPH-dependent glutamate synthase [candidate division KSB1 bacterium]|nr:NADPH-dependent glutamate synthase [candidate division KSB1 bacterium]